MQHSGIENIRGLCHSRVTERDGGEVESAGQAENGPNELVVHHLIEGIPVCVHGGV